MFAREVLGAVLLAGAGLLPAAAGEAEPGEPGGAGPEKPGELVRVVDHKPDGRVIGWVWFNQARAPTDRAASIDVLVTELCTEADEKLAKSAGPGNSICLFPRTRGAGRQATVEPADVAAFQQFSMGDRIEVEFYVETMPDKCIRFMPVTFRRLRAVPTKGVLAGTILGIDGQYVVFQVHETAAEAEHLRGEKLMVFYADGKRWLEQGRGYRFAPGPESARMLAGFKANEAAELAYTSNDKFYLAGLRKLDRPLAPLPKPSERARPKPKPADRPRDPAPEEGKPKEAPPPAKPSTEPESAPKEQPAPKEKPPADEDDF